ncbi:voltage-dependent calcium channel gamma-5 subunit-like isoform X1 [Centruroides vittatus]|uniref:voltage-dependent calcium channel gamma-5 subunit-like isoform X1 n=1 Tax=Centruroides vittatus TaxID=120091 RepID=UPI00350FA7AC
MPKTSVRVLRILMLITAVISLVAQAISLCSNCWLHSEEQMPNPEYNGTGDREYLSKFTVSGLWKLCYNKPGKSEMHCFHIDYFPKEEYSPDPNDSTMAIPYAVKRAATFIFISSLILILGVVLCFLGRILYRRPVLTFASGIAFILSGLFILAGMVIYISTFKSEVGNKLRPKSSFQGPLFIYHYGYSFQLAVAALMMCELAGTFAIFLYIHWYKEDNKKQMERQKFSDFTPVSDHTHCQRHWDKQNNYRPRESNHDMSPKPSTSRGRRNTNVGLPHSESMRDLAYYSFPPFSRDTTCNTVSTAADREYSREFSFETLRRTTPV